MPFDHPLTALFDPPAQRGRPRPGSQIGEIPPPAMVLVGSITDATDLDNVGNVAGVDDLVIASAADANQITVLDISDPTDPTIVGSVSDASQLFVPQGIKIIGTNAFVAVPGPECRLTVVSFATPSAPSIIGSVQDTTNLSNALYVAVYDPGTDYVVVAGNEVAVVDVSTPSSPTVVGTYDPGAESQNGLAVYQNYALTTRAAGDRLRIIDLSTPSAPTLAATFVDSTNLDSPRGIGVIGDQAFIACANSATLSVVDLSVLPSTPSVVETIALTDGDPVAVYGDYVISGAFLGNPLHAFDAHNPLALTDYASVDLGTDVDDLAVVGNYVVAPDSTANRVMVIELRNFAP